jgi:hypothetical protein
LPTVIACRKAINAERNRPFVTGQEIATFPKNRYNIAGQLDFWNISQLRKIMATYTCGEVERGSKRDSGGYLVVYN